MILARVNRQPRAVEHQAPRPQSRGFFRRPVVRVILALLIVGLCVEIAAIVQAMADELAAIRLPQG